MGQEVGAERAGTTEAHRADIRGRDRLPPKRGDREQAAVALIRAHGTTLKRTARRYSLCEDDAEDAVQRALEILLTKAPSADLRDLIRWMQTVVKH